MKQKIFLLLSALLLSASAWANTITYTASSELTTLKATKFTPNFTSHTFSGTTGTITFDSDVTAIGEAAFYGLTDLTLITIPNTVTSIDSQAFQGCTSLATVTFDSGSVLASLGSSAFSGCSALTAITIPKTVTSIGSSSF